MEKEIKMFDELMEDYLGPNKVVVEKTFTDLMPPGENYLSDMQKIHLVVKNKQTQNTEELDLIAKCVVETEHGPTFYLTKNEINFYTRILPAFQKFQEKHGIPPMDFFPKFIGGRINLTGGNQPDHDAVLVLENLKVKGYENLDRHVGFSLAEARVILKDLATFHLTGLALKLLEPETFKTEIKDTCDLGPLMPLKKAEDDPNNEESSDSPYPGPPKNLSVLYRYFESSEKYSRVAAPFKKFNDRMEKLMKNPKEFFNRPAPEPFGTLAHNDMWINNTMQKFRDGVIVSSKFVDFQMCRMASPVTDLIFFLTSSIQSDVLRTHFDNLIDYYFEIFSDGLKQYGCYGPQFSYEKFLDELKTTAEFPIGQCMFMLPTAVFTEKGRAFDMKTAHQESSIEDIPKLAIERIGILLLEATDKGWI